MPRYSRGVLRLVGALALFAALQPFSSLMQADDAGREFSRCVQNCNDARKACDDLCVADCQAMFPGTPNKPQRDACIAACKADCLIEPDDCKLVCQNIKNPSPEEP